jgi:hypothetical protein
MSDPGRGRIATLAEVSLLVAPPAGRSSQSPEHRTGQNPEQQVAGASVDRVS